MARFKALFLEAPRTLQDITAHPSPAPENDMWLKQLETNWPVTPILSKTDDVNQITFKVFQ